MCAWEVGVVGKGRREVVLGLQGGWLGFNFLNGSEGKVLKDREENERGLNVVRGLGLTTWSGSVYEEKSSRLRLLVLGV